MPTTRRTRTVAPEVTEEVAPEVTEEVAPEVTETPDEVVAATDAMRGVLSRQVTEQAAAIRAAAGVTGAEPLASTRALFSGTATRGERRAHIVQALRLAGLVAPYAPPVGTPEVTLTPKQDSVLRAMADGCSNTQTAEVTGLKVETVKSHQGNLHRKFGVNSRVEMVVEATRLGLLAPLPAPAADGPAPRRRAR